MLTNHSVVHDRIVGVKIETSNRILVICPGGGLCGVCLSGGFDQSLVGLLAMAFVASCGRFMGIDRPGFMVFISGPSSQNQIPVGSLDGDWIYFLFSLHRLRIGLPVLRHRWNSGCVGCDIYWCFVVVLLAP